MKILFVYGELVLEQVAGKYYHNFLGDIIDRYSPFGNLTLCVAKREVNQSNQSFVDCSNVTLEFINKENSLVRRFFCRKINKTKLLKLISESDFVIAHLPSSVSELAISYSKKMQIPYLAVVLGCPWDAYWNYNWKGKLMASIAYFSMKNAILNAPYALYVTDLFLQNRYPNKGLSIGCSDVSMPNSDIAILNKRLDKLHVFTLKQRVNIVTSASVEARFKGQQYVIKAISKLIKEGYDFHYYLIGGGDDSYLRKLSEKLGISERIHFFGFLPHEKVFEILDSMDIYIQPSDTEGLPRALVEAMGRALPSFGSAVGGIPELLGKSYLFRSGDVTHLTLLLKNINRDVLVKAAKDNFYKSQEYDRIVLNQKREEFLYQIMNKH